MNLLKIPENLKVASHTMRFMLYTLFCLIVADGLITEFLIAGGHGLEANPFLQFWISQNYFLAIKICGAFLVTLFLWIKYNTVPRLIYGATIIFLVFYTGVVFWNLIVFFTVRP
ncbi:DUF5658 family protein [Chloroflexota bacterium]